MKRVIYDDNTEGIDAIILVDITHYQPERQPPHVGKNHSGYGDPGNSEELEFTPSGFFRFAPDSTDSEGNPTGLMIPMTTEQAEKIIDYFNLEEKVFEIARELHNEGIDPTG